jgi:hypothetical protein
MTTYYPEFSAYWLGLPESGRERKGGIESGLSGQDLSPAQQVALEELVERVNAARSVV